MTKPWRKPPGRYPTHTQVTRQCTHYADGYDAGLIQPPPGYTGGYSGYEKTRIRDNLPLQYPPHYPYPT
jgi:hypothetical protein